MKRKTFWLMLFIVTLGTVLRLIFIDKPEGLWNDEYVSWSISVIPLGKHFVDAVLAQCHMPFYYLYLKFFIHFFGNSDLMLRLTSVLPGILSIIIMYFVGKEYKDNKLGILCASIASLSSFLIYFSQEVRFYELLFFFSALSLLYTLKLSREQSAKNFILYIVSNFLIIFTHTIGFVFVFLNALFLSLWLGKQEKYNKNIKIAWGAIFLISLAFLPTLFNMLTSHPLSQWWSHFSVSKIGFLITDYFSPMMTNIVSAPDNFFYNFTLGFLVFAIIPSVIAIVGIIKALMTRDKSHFTVSLFYICLAFIAVMVVMSLAGKLVFITKYSVEIYPILIAVMGFGLLEFKKGWRYFLIFLFCFLNLYYILMSPNSAPKMHRWEGHKIVAELLKNADLNEGDTILLNYYPQNRFEKYFNFNKYNVVSINKGTFAQYLGIDEKKLLKTGDKMYLKRYILKDNKVFDKKFGNDIIDELARLGEKHGKVNKAVPKIAIVILNDVAMYSPIQMRVLFSNSKEYEKVPYPFLVFSYLKNKELELCLQKLQISRFEQKGSWAVVTFEQK